LHVNDYTLHVVVYDDGHGMVTVSDMTTGEWHGIFVHARDQADTLFNHAQREATDETRPRISPTELLSRIPKPRLR
ncbi:hypothetical protein, partial [Saccharomonospora viridis]|uniref:hypothetical protein n=1 Tax=Saccharomonospora viridis TaxID=1852 RepID=UPI00240A05D1